MEVAEETKDTLREIINMGTGEASTVLSELLKRFIKLTIPEILIFDYQEMESYISSIPLNNYIHVTQKIQGDLSGMSALSFPVISGKTLVLDLLLEEQNNSSNSEFSSRELETIQEVGNKVIDSVGMMIAKMVNIQIKYTLPEVTFSKSIISNSNGLSNKHDIHCFSSTTFSIEDIDVRGSINLILTHDSIKKIEQKLAY